MPGALRLMLMQTNAAGTPRTLASGLTSPHGIAVGSTSVYWANVHTIMKAPK